MATSSRNPMPVWVHDSEIDSNWLQENATNLGGLVKTCRVEDISNATRQGDVVRNGATLKLKIVFQDDPSTAPPLHFVMKQIPPSGEMLAKQLGLAREALFYKDLSPKVKHGTMVPTIFYSYGDMKQGKKVVIMEDLSQHFIDSGILFGPGNPNNWNRDLPTMIQKAYPDRPAPTAFHVANQAFLAIARIHATFWKEEGLLEYDWLRGSAWIQGNDKASWESSQSLIQGIWNDSSKTVESCIQWDPLVKATVSKAMKGISWEAQLQRLNKGRNWTLVHGDFWPGNVLISTTTTNSNNGNDEQLDELRILDWEMVGVGSGPQDLGQYILSNMDPKERRECEKALIRNYYNELIKNGVSSLSWEECWHEYRIGGLERWLWFLVWFCGQPALLSWAQFFHDQIAAFLKDHQLGPDDVVQPRP